MDLKRDTIVETAIERRNMLSLLGTLQLFRGLDASILAAIAAEIEWFSPPGGASLFEAGDPPDALYFVISGCIGAFAGAHARRRIHDWWAVSRPVKRSARWPHLGSRARPLHARLRDSEIGRFSQAGLRYARSWIIRQAMLRIAQLTVQRLENSQRASNAASARSRRRSRSCRTGPDVDVRAFAEQLRQGAQSRLAH